VRRDEAWQGKLPFFKKKEFIFTKARHGKDVAWQGEFPLSLKRVIIINDKENNRKRIEKEN